MNPEPDPFENTLRALQRRPLPAEWRQQILQAAFLAPVPSQPARTPRWLLAGWGLAWAATLVLYLGTPAEPQPLSSSALTTTPPARLLQQHSAEIEALLAAN
ncbi:hypothetical protein [Prosthecobacter vanneervenii]|uniref:Uncharacterized protein n=1 Tax=Prosthecobacter vanneervenii TaxID=48466 RepID=A0A7W7YEF4_9BACT|nr:hypothetical protein [Prosthecobacter vanneervenii]MBB5034512.1 hypothetical protein [Prosthecobacter vanneervenii]